MSQALRLRLLRALFTPQVLSAALLAIGALALLLSVPRTSPLAPPTVDLGPATLDLINVEARLVLADALGLEWQRVVRVEVPRPGAQRLAAILAELRTAMVAEGLWPEELPAPRLFLETFDRLAVAVIDVQQPRPVALSVAQERALARALTATAEANGADRVRFLLNGRPTATLLGHVAVPSGL